MLDNLFSAFSDVNTELLTGNTDLFDQKHRGIHRKHRRKRTGNTEASLAFLTGNTEDSDQRHRIPTARIDQKHRWSLPSIDRKHRMQEFCVLEGYFTVLTRNTEGRLTGNTEWVA